MEYLQYTKYDVWKDMHYTVLNLIINGIPSIPKEGSILSLQDLQGFKPYYKWNTFNTITFQGDIIF